MDEEPTQLQSEVSPALAQAATPASKEPAVRMWAANAAQTIQDHIVQRQLINSAQQSGQQFENDVGTTRDNLVNMVRQDPTTAGLAFKLAGSFGEALDAAHGDGDSGLGVEVGKHFNSEIAKAAVQGWAGVNPGIAHAAIDRYGQHITAEEAADLRDYIGNMSAVREADQAAAMRAQAHNLVQQNNQAVTQHMGRFADPQTGAINFPSGWGQQMFQDKRLAPDAQAALYQGYTNLQKNGDPVASNPGVLSDLLSRSVLPYNDVGHPLTAEVASHLGGNLTLADAQFLAGRLGPQTPQVRDETTKLVDALGNARRQIGNNAAYGRFLNATLPAYQRAQQMGVELGDTMHPETGLFSPARVATFRPTGDDVVAPAVRSGPRRSLADIFGGR